MSDLTEILKYTLPVLIAGGGIIAVIILFFRLIDKRLTEQRRLNFSKTTLNLRLQAFERLILFLNALSRISYLPASAIRVCRQRSYTGISLRESRMNLITTFRSNCTYPKKSGIWLKPHAKELCMHLTKLQMIFRKMPQQGIWPLKCLKMKKPALKETRSGNQQTKKRGSGIILRTRSGVLFFHPFVAWQHQSIHIFN